MQQQPSKYGLKNASAFLQQFRKDKYNELQFMKNSMNEKQQTFDNCQIPSSKDSPQSGRCSDVLYGKAKHKSVVSCFQNGNNRQSNDRERNRNEQMQVNGLVQRKRTIGLAELMIKAHLDEKSKIFEKDLAQLQQNRDNLIQAIQDVSVKIHNLSDMDQKNKLLQLENFKTKKQIISLFKQYHEEKLNLQIRKLRGEETFHRKKEKIKALVDGLGLENQYVVECESWNQYYYELHQNKAQTQQYPQQHKVLQQIFPKPDQGKGKKEKAKNPQMAGTGIDKSSLLGDLKSFAKNFKMPTNPSNQC